MPLDLCDDINDEAKGKNPEALARSRQFRQEIIKKYGCVPTSILRHDKSIKAIDMLVDSGRDYVSSAAVYKQKEKLTPSQAKVFKASSQTCRGKGAALSRFPQEIGRLMLDLYCPERGHVYDPFAGHNSRMQLCFEAGRSYTGVDLSHEFMEANRKVRDILLKKKEQSIIPEDFGDSIRLIEGSSANVNLRSDIFNFTITSPPYWDLEYYGDETEQLGKHKTYNSFLGAIEKHVQENYRVLRPGAFCIWCINDFRKDGKFYSYHSDLINIFNNARFKHFNNYITDLMSSLGECFAKQIFETKILPKRHEYIIVFYK